MSDSLWPHGLQHPRLPRPPLSPRVCSDSCPLSQWCHPTISSRVIHFSCPQSFLVSGSFPVSWVFNSGAQVLELQRQSWLIWSPCHPRNSQESSPAPQFKSINSSMLSRLSLHVQNGLPGVLWHCISRAGNSLGIPQTSLKVMLLC